MAPKKKTYNGYAIFMMETRQKLISQGTKVSMADMSVLCKNDWENMSDEMKEEYKIRGKKLKGDAKVGKYTSIGENVEDVIRQLNDDNSQTNAMNAHIDVLLDMQPASHYLPKQKFILIHINPYTCEKEGFYFPAEISMAEFSLEKGCIRMFHQLIGFDKVRTNAPRAPTADINNHAANNHKIDVYSKFHKNYTEVLLKMIGFIMNKEVNAAILNDLKFDMPPVYTAHTRIENELMITRESLFKLFKSAVRDAERSDFNNIIRVYHLDTLFMKLENACYKVKNPGTHDLALTSVAMATDSLSKAVLNTIKTIGCNFHENLELAHVCSNYFVCKWINILSVHCCPYFDIELKLGRHYDFYLYKKDKPVGEYSKKMNISKFDVDYCNNKEIDQPNTLAANSLPALEGTSTDIHKPIWNKPEYKENTNNKTITDKEENFHQLDESIDIQKNSAVTSLNSWGKIRSFGRGFLREVQHNNQNQLNENYIKPPYKGRGTFEEMNVPKFDVDFCNNKEIDQPNTLAANSLPALEGTSTDIHKPIWNKPEYKENTNNKTITDKEENFHQLDESIDIQKNSAVTSLNSWGKIRSFGRGFLREVQHNNQNQLNENYIKPPYKGRGTFEEMNVPKFDVDFCNNKEIDQPNTLAANSLPALEGTSTDIHKPIWNKPEYKENTNNKTITDKEENFHQFDESIDIQKNSPGTSLNSWGKIRSFGRGFLRQDQHNNHNQLNENSIKPPCKGRGIFRNK